jgi:hypothetical protein
VFAHLDYADATPLRAACRGFRGAVAEHPWALPVPPPEWMTYGDARTSAVRTPAGLARWRAAFPAGRTLVLAPARRAPLLRDTDVAPAAAWGLTGVHIAYVSVLTHAGMAALCGPALTALCLWYVPWLSSAVVAMIAASSPRLRTLRLHDVGPPGADLAAWGGVHVLTVTTRYVDLGGSPLAGARRLTSARELHLPLSREYAVNWAGDAFRGLAHLTCLRLEGALGHGRAVVSGPAGQFAPGGLPRSLRHVTLSGLELEWLPGEAPDGGAALLRPLADVPGVALTDCGGVGDGGLCALAGATRLELRGCDDVAGERLAPLGRTLEELTVERCYGFTGGGLGSLAALRRLTVDACPWFRAGALVAAAVGCAALERADVALEDDSDLEPEFDAAAAQKALLAAAGGGSWACTDNDGVWTATRQAALAAMVPAADGAGDALVAAPAPAVAAAGGAGDDAALPDGASPLQPSLRQRVGE